MCVDVDLLPYLSKMKDSLSYFAFFSLLSLPDIGIDKNIQMQNIKAHSASECACSLAA